MSDSQPPVRTLLQQLASLQSDVQRLQATQTVDSTRTSKENVWRKRGRVLKRLVSLTDNIVDMLFEAERQNEDTAEDTEVPGEEQNRLYKCYGELRKWIPELQREIDAAPDVTTLDSILKHLAEGGDAGRSDDACRMKTNVIAWLAEPLPSDPPLSIHDKFGRGFRNHATGRLLCPAEYDWNSAEHRAKIRDLDPDFVVTANSWPAFLYEDYKYDPTDPVKGLFKGEILLKAGAFKLIFTSPTSVNLEDSGKRQRGERRTRDHVAQRLNMNQVTPRAIAYIAVQLRFALSDCGSWRLRDVLFDYPVFYHAIVKWFEDTDGQEEQAFVDELLLWWNRKIFGQLAVLTYHPQAAENASVAASFKRRRTNNVPVPAGPSDRTA